MARATSSLPVPDSPVMSTVLLVGAIVSTSWNTASIGPLLPMMFENWCDVWSARFSRTFSCCSRLRSSSLPDAHAQVALELGRLLDVVGRAEPQRLDRGLRASANAVMTMIAISGAIALRRAQQVDAVRHPASGRR